MSANITSIENLIFENVRKLTQSKTFKDWFSTQTISSGDTLLINNSFILRKPLIKTTKNSQYISVKLKNNKLDLSQIAIATPQSFDMDFKVVGANDKLLPSLVPLSLAVEEELGRLGHLMFFLIGELVEKPVSVIIQNSIIHELKFDPSVNRCAILEQGTAKIFVVNQLVDPEIAWKSVETSIKKLFGDDTVAFEKAFNAAFENLQKEARMQMNIPETSSAKGTNSFIAKLRQSIADQRKLYKVALDKCTSGKDENNMNLREIMRISYNFADDAIKLLQLFVCIADLKPVLLWSTIKAHYDVAESFRNLPWTKSDKKPSPANYVETVKGARNRAFHNLLFFDRTIEADLQGIQVNAKRLTLLPPYGQRNSTVALDYEDREMIEILKELTRATETVVSLEFWIKNSFVMEKFEKLLIDTETALWQLNSMRD